MPRQSYYLPQRNLVDQQESALVATPKVPRSKFINTWTRKTAFDAGYLYPIMVDELLPGDHMTYDVTAYLRMSTPLFPIFDNQRVDTHFFFVPSRLLWSNWERMLGSQAEPNESIDLVMPTIEYTRAESPIGGIIDHMGLPCDLQIPVGENHCVISLPFRAYNRIYNEWFRDQNLQDSTPEITGDDGSDAVTDYELKRRNKFHDYFTSALPWPQKFDTPNIPLLGNAPVHGIGIQGAGAPVAGQNWLEPGGLRAYPEAQVLDNIVPANTTFQRLGIEQDATSNEPTIWADLTAASGVTIADFRQAMLLQEMLERDARGGTRYIEVIKNHFGVTSQDARLQRPEYIGGGQTSLQITPIAQTAPTTGVPLGALGAAGTAAGQHHASYAATEHGYVIGLLSVRTELSYQQGVSPLWKRGNRYDFYWPTLAGLSEQAIRRREIFATGILAQDEAIWGYQERWQEYRTRQSEVTGIMRSFATGTLDAWHLAQEFSTAPSLNSDFIEDNPPMERVLAAGSAADGQQYIADIMYRRTAVRPIPTYGIPASLTHF